MKINNERSIATPLCFIIFLQKNSNLFNICHSKLVFGISSLLLRDAETKFVIKRNKKIL